MLPMGYGVPRVLTATPAITAGAYVAADAVGGKLSFYGAANAEGGWGFITGFQVFDKSQVKAALELVLFDRNFTAVADNTPFDVSDTDLTKIVAVIPTGAYVDFGLSGSVYGVHYGLSAAPMFRCLGSKHLYGQLRAPAGGVYVTTSDLTVKLSIVQMG
jgi:hypothetical protein